MLQSTSVKYGLYLNLLLSIGVSIIIFGAFYQNPTRFAFYIHGDGIKNYYTFLYHCIHGQGFHFTGMNYPFGEHVVYTDNQPLLSVILANLPGKHLMQNYLMVMNWMLPIAFLFSSVCSYFLFIRLNIYPYIAAVCSIYLTGLAPNLVKIYGHFGLSYSFFIPLTLLLLLQYSKHKKLKWLFGLFIVGFLVAQLHLYLIAIMMFLVIFYAFGYVLTNQDKIKNNIVHGMYMAGTIIASVIFVKGFIWLQDVVQDRPPTPWGFFYYTSSLHQVLTSKYSVFGSLFSGDKPAASFDEGYAYIGILSILSLLALLILFTLRMIKGNKIWHESIPSLFITGVLALILSMAIPFCWNMEWLLEILSPLKQFRTLGRFAIIFYYTLGIISVLLINQLLAYFISKRHFKTASLIAISCLALAVLEIGHLAPFFNGQKNKSVDNFTQLMLSYQTAKNDSLVLNHTSDYQAILTIPSYQVGTDKISLEPNGDISEKSLYLSLGSGLPLMCTQLARTSLSQTFAQMRFVSGFLTDKQLITSKLNSKPILILALPDSNKWRPGEKYIMEHATFIKDYEGLKLYSFHWEKCWNEENAWKDSVHQHATSKVPQINIVVDHMDQQENTNAFFGKGCLNIQHHDSLVLYDGPLHLQIGSNCEFSLWARVNEKDYRMPSVYLNFYDSSQKLVNRSQIWSAHEVNNSMQFWFRIYNQFVMQPNYHRLKIIFSNPDKKSTSFIDELQVRTLNDTTCFRGKQGVLFNNNLLIK